MSAARGESDRKALRRIKVLHTVVWAFFAWCILAILPVAVAGRPDIAGILIGVVAMEVVVLLLNGFRCPLTDLAARYTDERQDNFDIYLPLWLARYNKQVFGAAYLAGIVYTVLRWRGGGAG